MSDPSTGSLPVLPEEIWRIILDYTTAPDSESSPADLRRIIAVSSVCNSWRRAIVEEPALWRDTRFISTLPRSKAEHAKTLLRLCMERSKESLTHLELTRSMSLDDALHWLDVCETSAQCWRHVFIDCSALLQCDLDTNYRDPRPWQPSSIYEAAVEALMQALLQEVLPSAANLETITLTINSDMVGCFTIDQSRKPWNCSPHTVVLDAAVPSYDVAVYPEYDDTFPLLADVLTENMGHFTFLAQGDEQLLEWAWQRVATLAEQLKTLTMTTTVYWDEEGWPDQLSLLPALERATIVECLDSRLRHQPTAAVAISMPALKVLCASAALARHLHTPLVTTACFLVMDHEDLNHLPHILSARPDIETLTLAVVAFLHPGLYLTSEATREVQSATLDSFFALLTPKPGHPLLLPRLRHVGLLFRQLDKELTSEDTLHIEPSWAATTWPDQEIELYQGVQSDAGQSPLADVYASQLRDLELGRQRLSQGLDPEAGTLAAPPRSQTAPTVSVPIGPKGEDDVAPGKSPCVALETIKMGGVPISPNDWADIRQNTNADVTCYPTPELPPAPLLEGPTSSKRKRSASAGAGKPATVQDAVC